MTKVERKVEEKCYIFDQIKMSKKSINDQEKDKH